MRSFFLQKTFLSLAFFTCLGLNLFALGACGQPTQNEVVSEKSAEANTETTPEPAKETTPEPAKETTPEPAKETAPEAGPEPTPEPTKETVQETAPESTPEATPEALVETTPEAGPEPTPEPTKETTPEQTRPPSPNSTDPAVVWSWLQQEGYRNWTRAPGYATRQSSNAPHGGAVDIFINTPIKQIIDNKTPVTSWPLGSIIVKDGYNGSNLSLVAYMEKRSNGWLWFEWNGSGTILYQGQPSICTGCHSSGADFVRAFSFP